MATDLVLLPAGDVRTDDELVRAVVEGGSDAFEELYRRHVEASFRVAYGVIGNRDDAADAVAEAFARILTAARSGRLPLGVAFLPYLLRCVRNAAIDHLRRVARERAANPPTPQLSEEEPHLRAVEHEERSLVYSAFETLPERSRWALWLRVVEDMPPRSAAAVLQTTANNASQLATRALAALAAAYAQAHVARNVPPACEPTVRNLGTYAVAGCSNAVAVKVERHLEGCSDCRQRVSEIEELGVSLRRGLMVSPLPATLGARLWRAQGSPDALSSACDSVRSVVREPCSTVFQWRPTSGRVGTRLGPGLLEAVLGSPAVERVGAAVAAGVAAVSLSASGGGGSLPPSAAAAPPSIGRSEHGRVLVDTGGPRHPGADTGLWGLPQPGAPGRPAVAPGAGHASPGGPPHLSVPEGTLPQTAAPSAVGDVPSLPGALAAAAPRAASGALPPTVTLPPGPPRPDVIPGEVGGAGAATAAPGRIELPGAQAPRPEPPPVDAPRPSISAASLPGVAVAPTSALSTHEVAGTALASPPAPPALL